MPVLVRGVLSHCRNTQIITLPTLRSKGWITWPLRCWFNLYKNPIMSNICSFKFFPSLVEIYSNNNIRFWQNSTLNCQLLANWYRICVNLRISLQYSKKKSWKNIVESQGSEIFKCNLDTSGVKLLDSRYIIQWIKEAQKKRLTTSVAYQTII